MYHCRISLGVSLAFVALLVIVATSGCQRQNSTTVGAAAQDEHDHDHEDAHGDAPASYSAALTEIEELRDSIRKAFESDHPRDAHDAIHEIGELLDGLPKLASKEGVSGTDLDDVTKHADAVFEAFSDLDANFHGDDGQDKIKYDDVAETVDAGLAELDKYAKSGEGHEHDADADHGHDEDAHSDDDHDEDEGHTNGDGHEHVHDDDENGHHDGPSADHDHDNAKG